MNKYELNDNELNNVYGGKTDDPKNKKGPEGIADNPTIEEPFTLFICDDFRNLYNSCNECPYRSENKCTVNKTIVYK